LKEKVIKPPSSNTFIEVYLNKNLKIINDVKKERRFITPHVFPTPPHGGVYSIEHGSFQFSHLSLSRSLGACHSTCILAKLAKISMKKSSILFFKGISKVGVLSFGQSKYEPH
jgi:hypothetical protein